MAQESNLREPKRFVTTHNPAGLAMFSNALAEDGLMMGLNCEEDIIKTYKGDLENDPGLTIGNGQVLRYADFAVRALRTLLLTC
ncbi:hypothetical protein EJ05DRAFT_514380 [Pseudovirgaria hyperparasitica]|uniref:Uncharacterized protein n=1 Tax=Pseudovirgaria hyperparasitica TaxID=470096 RepID=A0A6A6VVZ5_9PEZI|nr:uncharacterized protein EJ05DRAFT_514380 [Pseudovirgaria hyperparasitica]KAF2753884.1 hypothetical protein EJ05DRAFT_514380 [Pseudovirgaria hyperparasitica]